MSTHYVKCAQALKERVKKYNLNCVISIKYQHLEV